MAEADPDHDLLDNIRRMVPGSNSKDLRSQLKRADIEHDDLVHIEPYAVPLVEAFKNEKFKIRHLIAENRNGAVISEATKTILVVGETGCGKTKLVDGLFNFLWGVKWDDNIRWKLTELTATEKERSLTEEKTQTEYITIYSPPRFPQIDYLINIIDTPGFGYTVANDQALRKSLQEFFEDTRHGVNSLDAICIVSTASNPRLTKTQTYIYQTILAIFGEDIKQNIFVVATHADDSEPKVYKAMKAKNIPMKEKIKVNNSALYANNNSTIRKMFWEINEYSYGLFVSEMLAATSISTEKTREVLRKREQLTIHLQDASKLIKENCNRMKYLLSLNETLENHLNDMEENKDFVINTRVPEMVQVKNRFLTKTLYCNSCQKECHYPCVPLAILKRACSIFNWGGTCSLCNCTSGNHSMQTTHKDQKLVDCQQTKKDVEAKYMTATKGKDNKVSMMDNITKEYNDVKKDVLKKVQDALDIQKQLNKISLIEDPVTRIDIVNHILATDEMIDDDPKFGENLRVLAELYNDILAEDFNMKSVSKTQELNRYLKHSKLFNEKLAKHLPKQK